ncbi:PIN domain-containing protein [soil metagenome]
MIDTLFLDTAFVYGLFNTRDQWHQKAVEWQQKIALENYPLITTEFVLTEIANGLSAVKFRQDAGNIIHILQDDDFVRIIPAVSELFRQGLDLYENRNDKDWGLTDCTSFVVMKENNITAALTTDDHFRQAGFRALLLE